MCQPSTAQLPHVLASLLRIALGSLYCGLWLGSIVCGWLWLCCPTLTIMLVYPPAYRAAMDAIFAMWELYPTALLRLVFGTRVVVCGDDVNGSERALMVMNHRTRLDWNFLWSGMYSAARPANTRLKFVLKAPIAHVPGPGWVMQMACHLYIHRDWSRDQKLLWQCLRYFHAIDHTYQILLFPEGTDLTTVSKARSDSFADTRGLPHYRHVIHPKTTGFSFLADTMRRFGDLDAVYDVTVGYPRTLVQSEMDLLRGRVPEEIHFHFKRYAVRSLPKDPEQLRSWLEERWAEKEAQLDSFYERGSFEDVEKEVEEDDGGGPTPAERRARAPTEAALCLAFLFWTGLVGYSLVMLYTSSYFRMYAGVHAIFFVALSFMGIGAHQMEVFWYLLWHPNTPM